MNHELLCTGEDNLLALASDRYFDLGVPCVDINDIARLVDIIESRVLHPAAPTGAVCRDNG